MGEPTRGTLRSKGRRRDMEPWEGKMSGTSSSESVSTRLLRIAELARNAPGMTFTTLAHHIDIDWMREAYRRTRKEGPLGVAEQSADAYSPSLAANV